MDQRKYLIFAIWIGRKIAYLIIKNKPTIPVTLPFKVASNESGNKDK